MKDFSKKLFWILIANAILATPSLWVPFYNIDEITNAIFGRLINAGEMSLRDFVGSTYLLTHYIYAFIFSVWDIPTLLPLHIFFIGWKTLAIVGIAFAGKEFFSERAGISAALFLTVSSYSFMSKDFHSPNAEHFSIMPAAWSLFFIALAYKKNKLSFFFLSGLFCGLATLCKTPMGILFPCLFICIILEKKNLLSKMGSLSLGFLLVLLIPPLLVTPLGSGFPPMFDHINHVRSFYIGHDTSPAAYWISKFLLRTALIYLCCFGTSFFALWGLISTYSSWKEKKLVASNSQSAHIQLTIGIMLSCFALGTWLTATLGHRVFYHYFVFSLLPLSLLASMGIEFYQKNIFQNEKQTLSTSFFRSISNVIYKKIYLILVIPLFVFTIEGAFNFSTVATLPHNHSNAIKYISGNTTPDDRIYIWGYTPQLYFYSQRLPASTFIWSNTLAGSTPGTGSTELMEATQKKMPIVQALKMDLSPNLFAPQKTDKLLFHGKFDSIEDAELLTVTELAKEMIDPHWQQVMHDLLRHKPKYIIDTSPANYRGFANFPIENYPPLKKFLAECYQIETDIDFVIFYRFQKNRCQNIDSTNEVSLL